LRGKFKLPVGQDPEKVREARQRGLAHEEEKGKKPRN